LQRALWRCGEHLREPQPRDLKLATLCQHYGVPLHAAAAHDALADAEATAALYRQMLNPVSRVRLARAG
jgi:DNA polymerase III epsilon subunit-like protein